MSTYVIPTLSASEGGHTHTFVMLWVGAIATHRAADAAHELLMMGVLDYDTFTGGAEREEVDSRVNRVERVMEREERDRLDAVNEGCNVSLDDGLYDDEKV